MELPNPTCADYQQSMRPRAHAASPPLQALRLDHQPVIDTSLIFGYRCVAYWGWHVHVGV